MYGQEMIDLDDYKTLKHYQNKLTEEFNQIPSAKAIDFNPCRKLIASVDLPSRNELLSLYCDLLLDNLTIGYLRYSELIKFSLKQDPYYVEFRSATRQLTDKDPLNQIFFAVIDLLNRNYTSVGQRLEIYIPAKIKNMLSSNISFTCSDFIYCFVLPLKEGFPGMWRNVGQLLNVENAGKGFLEMCEALDYVYYSSKNEEIIDALTRVLQRNPDIYLAKELLGYTYYNMQMWGNALSYFEQLEEVEDRSSIFYFDNIYFWMAWCYGKKRNYTQEAEYYRKALKIYPEAENAMNNLGYCLYKQKKYSEAEKIFRKCLSQKRDIRYAANNLVRTLLAAGKVDEAKKFALSGKYKINQNLIDKLYRTQTTDKLDISTNVQEGASDAPVVHLGVKKYQFTSEKILEDELVHRIESGIPVFGMPLKLYQRRGVYGRQYILRNGRLDILATDSTGNLYVIELKKDSGYDDAYTQTRTYVDWVQEDLACPGQSVYGIICLNNPTSELQQKVKADPQIRLFEYHISYCEL